MFILPNYCSPLVTAGTRDMPKNVCVGDYQQTGRHVVNPIKINYSRLAVKTAYEVTGSRRGRRKFGKHETEEFGERGDRSETKEFGERSGSTGAFGKRFPRKSPNTFFQRDVYFFFTPPK